ncbi:hypothetical protein R1flu_015466 [Riccia fluitans]|uniref:Uncharacterized protein n=1 Tax=Riccia fluitans TaxID=41844 RepID=A0ABD1YJF6_9MARC
MLSLSDAERDPEVLKVRWTSLVKIEALLEHERARNKRKLQALQQHLERKWTTRYHNLVSMQGTDLHLLVYRGKKSMWPDDSLSMWNARGAIVQSIFPGWILLPKDDGGMH